MLIHVAGFVGLCCSYLSNTPWSIRHGRFRDSLAARSAPVPIVFANASRMQLFGARSVSKKVIINLPVVDLAKSVAFFRALGYSSHTPFAHDACARTVIRDAVSLLLLTHVRFRDFTPNSVCDTNTASEVLLWLSCESRQEVDRLVAIAVAAGGATSDEADDYGFVYTRRFVDPDGHGWGLVHTPVMACN